MSTRRNFIKETGMLAAGLALAPSLSKAFAKPNQNIGIQLYSLRDIIGKDVKGVIEKVAKAGFKEVETYGYAPKDGSFWGLTPKQFKALLDANGLRSPSGHFGFDDYVVNGNSDDIKAYIDASTVLGSKYVVAPWLGENLRKTADDYKKVADRLNNAGELCKKAGLTMGYHNHGFEFEKHGDQTGLEILLKNTDQSLVHFELDLYWAVYAGENPVNLFKKYPGRFKMWHVKDMDKTNRDWNTEIGKGSIDFKSIFAAASLSGVKHIYLEQETNYKPDHIGSINASIKYIKGNLL